MSSFINASSRSSRARFNSTPPTFCYTNPPPPFPESDSRCSEIGRQCVDEDESIDEGEDSDNGGGPSGDESSMCAFLILQVAGAGGGTGLTGTDEGLTNEDGVPVSCSDEDPCDTDGEYTALDQNGEDLKQLWESQRESNKEQVGIFAPLGDSYTFQSLDDYVTYRSATRVEFKINPSTIQDGSIYVHTHPTRETANRNDISYGNYHHASDPDKNALQTLGVDKGFILDEGKILVYDETGVIDDVDRCGY